MKRNSSPARRALGVAILFALSAGQALAQAAPITAPGLTAPGSISYDAEGVASIIAQNDLDLAYLTGYQHARDRFFQMDFNRRAASGTLAEMVGSSALASDVQLRTLGLRRAAWETYVAQPQDMRDFLQAYANGVNFWLRTNPLPPEYGPLELTTVDPWSPVDSLAIAKVLAFQLSFDLDIDFTLRLAAYQAAGQAGGFNGTALFFEDTHRIQPGDNRVSIPNFLSSIGGQGEAEKSASAEVPFVAPEVGQMAQAYRDQVADNPIIGRALEFRENRGASNWWIVAGNRTASGKPIIANDPHLGLDTPSIFYENRLYSAEQRGGVPYTFSGSSFPGIPGGVLGCSERACWGSTVHPMDVTDVFQERFRLNTYGLPTHTIHGTTIEPVVWVFQSFFANNIGDGQPNTIGRVSSIGYTNGGVTVIVPRRNNGPVLQITGDTGLSVAYTGWGATNELQAFRALPRTRNVQEFRDALNLFDVGSQNFGYADIDGNIAYFTSAENPLRTDLQTLGRPDGGVPPFIIRDGTGALKHDWLPRTTNQPGQSLRYEILPPSEMPFVINPSRGYIANANNDPIGVTLDNNALNQLRPGGGIYYLNHAYSAFRMGRIDRILEQRLASGQPVTADFIKQAQANNQPLDAEKLTPFLLQAAANARQPNAWSELRTLIQDARVAAAIDRLAAWDYSTPTGIREGFDPGDNPAALPEPSATEVRNSTAATVFAIWRSFAIASVVDGTLNRVGLTNLPGSEESVRALLNLLERFPSARGVGASGLNFFQVTGAPSPEAARDAMLLRALRDGLNALSGNDFAAAFANSTNLDDYRWGRLHRIVFDHPLGGPFNLPGANPYGFSNLSPNLPGVARPGGYEVLDASGHSTRARTVNGFMFGSGPARRFVGTLSNPIAAENIHPGGQSGVLGSQTYASQLGRWLTNNYKPLLIRQSDAVAGERQRLEFRP
jgi:penicillin amidase